MTETDTGTKNGAGTAGDAGGKAADVSGEVLRQMDYYFGNFNLPKDKFLKNAIEEAKDGWISLDIMLKFQRLANITSDKDVIIKAVKDSEVLETNEEKQEVRRKPSLGPIPEWNDDTKKENVAKSVYCKGFEKDKTTLDDLLKFFHKHEGVVHVVRRTYGKDNERFFKGSTFVTFKDKESAQKFLDLEEVKTPEGEVLMRKWQQEYFDEKDAEYKEKAKARQDKKKQNKQAKEVLEAKEEEEEGKKGGGVDEGQADLPTGTILVMKGFKNADTKREDIKDCLKNGFEIKPEAIAFVYFNKGESEAKLRFSVEDAAKDAAKKINESLKEGEKLKIKEDEIEVRALEGQEESEFLDKCKADIAQQKEKGRRGHKRHSGRPGFRGGNSKRQRRN